MNTDNNNNTFLNTLASDWYSVLGGKKTGANISNETSHTHFSRPSPTTAILLLSSVHAMSLTLPEIGVYSYLSRCSFWVVSQIRILPDTSEGFKNNYFIILLTTLCGNYAQTFVHSWIIYLQMRCRIHWGRTWQQ